MEFRVLGPLEVLRDGVPVDLGAFRQRAVLGLLLTSPNSVWSTDQIVDGVWGEDAGGDKQNALWVYVSGLRKALEPDRPKRTDGTVLLTRAPGYLVDVDPDSLDSARFERLVAEGRSLAERDPAAASLVLSEALALWRGRAFEDFTYESFAQAEIARLEELRIEAVSARIQADLDCGRARQLVSELEALVRLHPLREELTGLWMLALYRSGRQAEALRAYQLLRSRLAEELGLDPSTRIRRLHDQMVAGDEALEPSRPPQTATGTSPGLAVRGYELREQVGAGEFGVAYRAYQPAIGREVAIKVIRAEVANDPDFIRRFEAEARLVAQLEHPHIVPLYDFWREPDAAYLVMRLMRGGSLADRLADGALTPAQASSVADQLAGALGAAHRSGVVHRDVKPANVLIDDDGNAYLSDFGIALGGDGPAAGGSGLTSLSGPSSSPEQLGGEPVAPPSDVYSLGVVMAQALTGLRGDVEQIRGALPTGVRAVIDRATAVEVADRCDVHTFAADLRGALVGDDAATTVEVRADLVNPYKGLRAFDGTDAADFFGRDRLIERLVARLGTPGPRGRFVAVVGPSGSGKSSVVRAGLLPALRGGALPDSNRWFVIEMTPAPHPFESLEDALLTVAVDPPASMLELLVYGDAGLAKALEAVLPNDGSQALLVVDQLEELFTQVAPTIAKQFLDAIAHAVTAEHSRLRVVVTLRADFYDRPLDHSAFGELLHEGTQVITPLTADQLERAITGPVESLGVTFEPALVAELVHDMLDRAGALPLLQYTLTELFDLRQANRITTATYRELGGVAGALVKRAEGLLAGLDSGARNATRQVFLRLVTLGDTDGHLDTRRRALQTELEQLGLDRNDLRIVLETFGRHRLLSFDRDPVTRGPTVEISHEALLSEWTRLHDWIEAARDDLRNQRRLAEAVREWDAAGRSDAYLLRGGRLEQLDGWARTTDLTLSAPERDLLDCSVQERRRAADEESEREQRVAEAERQARRRMQQLVGVGMVGVLIAALAVFGIRQWSVASDARDQAEAARDANQSLVMAEQFKAASEAALASDPELALLFAVEAVRASAELGFAAEGAVDSLHWALQQGGVRYPVGAEARSAIRSGPTGLTGVFLLSPAELVELAENSTERRLTADECLLGSDSGCPERVPIDPDLPFRFGEENYFVDVPDVVSGRPTLGRGPLAGTRITLATAASTASNEGLRAELDRFTGATGIQVDLVSDQDVDVTPLLDIDGLASVPDVVVLFSPPPPWAEPRAVDLAEYLDVAQLRNDFGDYLVDIVTSEHGELHGVVFNTFPSGLVFYPKQAFDAAGYEVPATWDELVALSHDMLADGRTPWCIQWGAGAWSGYVDSRYWGNSATGFSGPEFLASLVLRVSGLDAYDAWASGAVPFDSPAVIEAALLGDELLRTPGLVRGGTESIGRDDWALTALRLLDVDPLTETAGPQCWLVHNSSRMLDLRGPAENPASGRLGEDIDYFVLPPLHAGQPAPIIGGANFATALSDRPEIRTLMRFIASPSWGEVMAGEDTIGQTFISSNRRFNPSFYTGRPFRRFDLAAYSSIRDHADIDVRVRLHNDNRAALDNGTWRLGAHHLMPVELSTGTDQVVPGPFEQGMLDWADGVKPIEEILTDIQTARDALDESSSIDRRAS